MGHVEAMTLHVREASLETAVVRMDGYVFSIPSAWISANQSQSAAPQKITATLGVNPSSDHAAAATTTHPQTPPALLL